MRPNLNRGDEVEVTEPGVRPWFGTVLAVKPATPWRVEVRREDGLAFSCSAEIVHRV